MSSLVVTILLGISLLGGVAGVIGAFSVLRRRSLMGDLLAHAALPGLCLAFLVFGRQNFAVLLLGAFISGLAGIAVISFIGRWTRTKEDAAIGIVLSTFFGAGIVLSGIIQRLPTEESSAGIRSYIYGQAAAMATADVWAIAGVGALGLITTLLLYKEFKVFSFDPEFAQAQGWPTLALDLVMMGTLALVTMVGLPAVGVVLMAALRITPSSAARFWTDRLSVILVLSGIIGAVTGMAGTIISAGLLERWLGFDPLAFGYNQLALPTGPLVVLCGTAIFVFSMLFAPRRGIVARLWSEVSLRGWTARENLLRTMYELTEPGLPNVRELTTAELLSHRTVGKWQLRWLLARARGRGWVQRTAGGFRLTPRGLVEAARVTRAHRLWELFLIEGANIASDHVDRDADAIEHLLSADVLARLESQLVEQHRMPSIEGDMPHSPHDLAGEGAREAHA